MKKKIYSVITILTVSIFFLLLAGIPFPFRFFSQYKDGKFDVKIDSITPNSDFTFPKDLSAATVQAKVRAELNKLPDLLPKCTGNAACTKWLKDRKAYFELQHSSPYPLAQEISFLTLGLDEMETALDAMSREREVYLNSLYKHDATFELSFLRDAIAVRILLITKNHEDYFTIEFNGLARDYMDKLLALQYFGNLTSYSNLKSKVLSTRPIRADGYLHIGTPDTLYGANQHSPEKWTPSVLRLSTTIKSSSTLVGGINEYNFEFKNKYYREIVPLFEVLYSIMNGQYLSDAYFCENPPKLTTAQRLAARGFSGGDGSLQNPFKVCTAAQLLTMNKAQDLENANYILMRDINLGALKKSLITANEGYFTGSLDGNGYALELTDVKRAPSALLDLNGLFGNLFGATIKNLKVVVNTFFVKNPSYSAFFAGHCSGATFENVILEIGESNVPALCGEADALNVKGLEVTGTFQDTPSALISYLNSGSTFDQISANNNFIFTTQGSLGSLITHANLGSGEKLLFSNSKVTSYIDLPYAVFPKSPINSAATLVTSLNADLEVNNCLFELDAVRYASISSPSALAVNISPLSRSIALNNSYFFTHKYVPNVNTNGLKVPQTWQEAESAFESLPKNIWINTYDGWSHPRSKLLILNRLLRSPLAKKLDY